MKTLPIRRPDQGMGAFQDDQCPQIRGRLLKDRYPLFLAFGNRLSCEPRHLSRMGCQDRRCRPVPDDLPMVRQGGNPVAVDKERLFDPGGQIPDELLRFGSEGKAGTHNDHVRPSGQLQEGLLVLQREASLGGFRLGDEDDFASPRGQEGGHRPGGGKAGISPAGLQERHGGKVRGAVIARRAGDEQDVPRRPFVERPLAQRKRDEAVDLDLDRLIVAESRRKRDAARDGAFRRGHSRDRACSRSSGGRKSRCGPPGPPSPSPPPCRR